MFVSIDPTTGVQRGTHPAWSDAQIETALAQATAAAPAWRATPVAQRAVVLHSMARILRSKCEAIADVITAEMGKLRREALAEVEKSAWGCEFYADMAQQFTADEPVATDATRSLISFEPLGTVLAIMPWNFPLWQVLRFAAPALAVGNTALLKHSSNVPECALLIESLFEQAGAPAGVFRTLMIRAKQTERVIADPRIHAITLTGSEAAGRRVAAIAGANLKKCVLELGGSDPFIVLEDADLDYTVSHAVTARFQNAGQSCIAAKRFIVVDGIADAFVQRFAERVAHLQPGDPRADATSLAPLARDDLRGELQRQVSASTAQGATMVVGGAPVTRPGFFFQATVLDHVRPGTPAWSEELFGPVAAVIRVPDATAAVAVANASRFGLGGSVWTQDVARGERVARQLACGAAFVNGMVKSDPRLPFGGVKDSGYGRELSRYGLLEFTNIKTIWIK